MYEHHREREGIPVRHELAKELLAGFRRGRDRKALRNERYGHLSRHEARRLARDQAEHLWRQQYG